MAIRIIHCQSYQVNNSIISKGNNQANEAASAEVLKCLGPPHTPQDTLILQPTFSLSSPDIQQILSCLHQIFHCNSQAVSHFIKTYLQPTSEGLSYLKTITGFCKKCQTSSPTSEHWNFPFPIHQVMGPLPGLDWQHGTCPQLDISDTFWFW